MCNETKIETLPRYPIFRIGKLLFGLHGLLGVVSIITTTAAVYFPSKTWLLVMPSQLCNFLLVNHARSLLNQVPTSTQIFPGVVAPHKEAFQRTILVMQYLIARVIIKYFVQNTCINSNLSNAIASFVILWRWYPLVPNYYADWWNGNTWIFVVPICLGVSGDLYVYFVYGDLFEVYHLLSGELLGLSLAFGFTLGFRNYIPMSMVYCGAALSVWAIIQQGIATVNNR
jgi:hypothetical protein